MRTFGLSVPMHDAWHSLMVWLDTSTVPVWAVFVVFLVYFGVKLFLDTRHYDE